ALSRLHGPDFLFHDLRPYYQLSRQRARELDLYRQKYCGCIFSELERIGAKAKRQKPLSSIADMPKAEARPFTLPGLDPDETARLFESATSPSQDPEEKWRPWGSG
ncbi:MAG: hypothetical protein GTO55_00665, partial [Armatimonadetes bacterium]|nr:hypothetical protein [Armatimonadota bacterium]NIM22800.1 hypothetical protein [Armatimonadota bacterium]NIM66667.1 hypothetical protein [Armatimonadota bacterium]NIM75219.1 hypothetical protein [Armatimonadota bacterium]NIN04860.1 hypothetical protein [Armatimonadota bacterium]